MANSNPTQCERIDDYLHTHGAITSREAMDELGVYRLASRISEMRRDGMPIGSRMIKTTNRYGEKVAFKQYFLEE